MTVSIDDFVDNIRADVPGCPDPAIENAFRDSVIDFCRKTRIIQRDFVYNTYDVDAVDELNDEPVLEFDGVQPTITDVGMRPVVVVGAWVTEEDDEDYAPLVLMSKQTLAKRPYAYWASQTTTGLPTNYFAVSPDTIRVYPVPSINYYLLLRAAFKPEKDAIVFDDDLYDDWLEEICSGAKARLFGMPNKPWTDYQVALFEKSQFNVGVGNARIAVSNHFSGTSGQVNITVPFTS